MLNFVFKFCTNNASLLGLLLILALSCNLYASIISLEKISSKLKNLSVDTKLYTKLSKKKKKKNANHLELFIQEFRFELSNQVQLVGF